MSAEKNALLGELLKAVSRSFYLTLRVLPGTTKEPIGLAYLLARATDTIADTELIPVTERLDALTLLRDRILGVSRERLNFDGLAAQQGNESEKILLERIEEALRVLERFEPADKQLIQTVLEVITSGQELDLRRFAGASAANIIALRTETELDDYTYRVAGCVGEFWTRICRAHLFPKARLNDAELLSLGVRFGKGLQLVNILRDLPVDLRNGRCYLPKEELASVGLEPRDLLEPKHWETLRPVYERYLDLAEADLRAGWDYTNALPRGSVRVRLACAWPLLIGIRTVARLRLANVCDASQRVKVSRSEIKSIILKSVWSYPFAKTWRGQFPKSNRAKRVIVHEAKP